MGPSFIDPSFIAPPSCPSSTPHPIPPHVGGGERSGTCGSALHRPPNPAFGSPDVSLQPIARFRFWMAWPAAPFTRLSRTEKTTTRPDAPAWTEIRWRVGRPHVERGQDPALHGQEMGTEREPHLDAGGVAQGGLDLADVAVGAARGVGREVLGQLAEEQVLAQGPSGPGGSALRVGH